MRAADRNFRPPSGTSAVSYVSTMRFMNVKHSTLLRCRSNPPTAPRSAPASKVLVPISGVDRGFLQD